MKDKRYRGRGKYLVLEKPTPLTTVYANLFTITCQIKVELMNVFTAQTLDFIKTPGHFGFPQSDHTVGRPSAGVGALWAR